MTAAKVTALPGVEPPTDSSERTYTAPEVVALTGISYRQLDYWVRVGFLPDSRPDRQHRSGHHRCWTLDEIEVIRLVLDLTTGVLVRLEVRSAFELARHVIEHGEYVEPLADIYRLTIEVRP